METPKITSQLSAELRQKYQDIEEMYNLKENFKKPKDQPEQQKKQTKQEKIVKLCEKIKDADSNKTSKKKHESLLKEIKESDLSKSLPEMATTIIDCTLHQSNIRFFVDLCYALSNYEDFNNLLLKTAKKQIEQLDQKMGNFENEDKRAQKRKNLLRLFGELHQLTIQNEQFAEILRLLLPINQNLEFLMINIQVITNFMNHFGYEYFGKHKFETRKDLSENPELQNIFRDKKHNNTIEAILKEYVAYIERVLIDLHAQIKHQENDSVDSKSDPQKTKEIKDQKENYLKLKENFIKLKENYKQIKDCMGEYDPSQQHWENEILNLNHKDFQQISSDDSDCFLDEERRLYCQLITIEIDPNRVVTEDKPTKQKDCSSIEVADQMAQEFVNNKQNRKKLIEELQNFKQNYIIIMPFQCRLLATLCKNYKEFEEDIIKSFLDQYRQIKSNDHPERKSRYLRYLCELTKFKILKQDIILDILSSLLEDLISQNVELIVLILECCGRFLKYSGESCKKFEYLLTQLDKQRKIKPLSQQQESLLIKALLSFDRQSKPKKEKTPLQKFIKYLIFDQLDDFNQAFESMERLPLADPVCKQYLIKQLIKISIKGRYSSLSIVACLLAALKEKYPEITGQVVDALLDDIQSGLEDNNINKRQRRITITKMIGELYAYRIIDKDLLFKLLYLIIEFGHDADINQNEQDQLDPPDDSFRINQVIGLIESVREYYKQLKTELLKYLVYFQRYVLSKKYLPQIVEFALLDLYETIDVRLSRIKTIKLADQIGQAPNIEDALAKLPDGSSQLQSVDKKQIEDQKEYEQSLKLEQELEQQFQQQLKESHQEVKKTSQSNQSNKNKSVLVVKGSGEVKVVTKIEVSNSKKTQVPNKYVGFSQ